MNHLLLVKPNTIEFPEMMAPCSLAAKSRLLWLVPTFCGLLLATSSCLTARMSDDAEQVKHYRSNDYKHAFRIGSRTSIEDFIRFMTTPERYEEAMLHVKENHLALHPVDYQSSAQRDSLIRVSQIDFPAMVEAKIYRVDNPFVYIKARSKEGAPWDLLVKFYMVYDLELEAWCILSNTDQWNDSTYKIQPYFQVLSKLE